jgi:UDP-2,4-diacetamido-2,4,6-trideoxy-beta-L-altropyranose hydrolase
LNKGIAFRVDSSVAIGTGHLKRCMVLANEFRRRGKMVYFVTRELGTDASQAIVAGGFELCILPKPVKAFVAVGDNPKHANWAQVQWRDDAEETSKLLCNLELDLEWLVIDHYSFDARWHDFVRNKVNCKICVVDDLGDRALRAELILDQNWHVDHRQKYQKVNLSDAKICGGPDYALLSSAYATATKYQWRPTIESIGVFMGGIDSINGTRVVLDAIRATKFNGQVEIVTTRNNPHLTQLKAIAARTNKIMLSVDLPNLADFYARHDLQIGAGGSATWERFCIGAPTVAISCADNQLEVLRSLVAKGFQWGIENLCVEKVAQAIIIAIEHNEDRRILSMRTQLLVDGNGAKRFVSELLKGR